MRDRIFFFSLVTFAALTTSPVLGIFAVSIAYLAGMRDEGLVVLFGTATAGTFGALMMLSGLAATLFFGPQRTLDEKPD